MPQRNASRTEDEVLDCTVHIVDDDSSFRTALERRLTKAGYSVATYAGGQHLLDDLSEESGFGCIIMDVRIPGMSGPELQSRLVERGSTLPILFITGYPRLLPS
jgi:FixJ family two-component response regulator